MKKYYVSYLVKDCWREIQYYDEIYKTNKFNPIEFKKKYKTSMGMVIILYVQEIE
jgi:hypothetical protein